MWQMTQYLWQSDRCAILPNDSKSIQFCCTEGLKCMWIMQVSWGERLKVQLFSFFINSNPIHVLSNSANSCLYCLCTVKYMGFVHSPGFVNGKIKKSGSDRTTQLFQSINRKLISASQRTEWKWCNVCVVNLFRNLCMNLSVKESTFAVCICEFVRLCF